MTALEPMRAREQYDRLDALLYLWAAWMRSDHMQSLGMPSRSPTIGVSHGADFDQIYDQVTGQTAEAVNGCVESLGKAEQAALRADYLGEVWRYQTPIERVLTAARETLQTIINRRGIA